MDIERFVSPQILNGVNIFTSKSGHVTARCNDILLHSSHDPVNEGDRFAEASGIKGGDTVLLYGFGLGYHVDSILRAVGKDGNLLIIELNREILSAAFIERDISNMLSQSNLWIITGDSEAEVSAIFLRYTSEKWDSLPDNNKKVIIFSPSLKCMPDGFEKIRNAFEMLQMDRRFSVLLGGTENRNFRLNREAVLKSEGIKELFGKFKGLPGILVSSGPSLDPSLSQLKSLSKNVIIMAVDSALHALIRNDIKPDFTISIDPQEFSYIHLTDYFDSYVPLIFLPTSNPVVVKKYKGEKFITLKKYEGQGARGKGQGIEDKGYTEGGGSVSCIALDILIKLGANPIILVGQDCAFPGNRFYSNAISEGERWFEMINGFYMLRDIHKEKISEQKTVYVTDRFGLSIPTHENLYGYIRNIEEIVKREKDVSFYNLNSKGVGFRGVEDIPSLSRIKELWNYC
ncbi:MAG: motility associated factor glycosyltransferase family protein [Nitrospinae bacterium]|nr:motility associated factor glycosyltransferase family protein [Nitrospinota bacterium]